MHVHYTFIWVHNSHNISVANVVLQMNRNARERASMAPYSLFSLFPHSKVFSHSKMIRSSTILLYGLAFFFFLLIFTRITRKVTQKLMNYYWRKKTDKRVFMMILCWILSFFLSLYVYLFSLKCRSKWTLFKRIFKNGFDGKRNRNDIKEKNLFK